MVINVIFKKEYLKEFLIAFTGGNYPVKATEFNLLGKFMKPLLEKKPDMPIMVSLQREFKKLQEKIKEDSNPELLVKAEELRAQIHNYKDGCIVMIEMVKYRGIRLESINHISLDNMRLLEGMIHDFFKEIFNIYVDAKIESGFSKTDSINQFCYRYNLPLNSMNFEMLKKKHDRHEKSQKTIKNANKNVVKMSREMSHRLTTLQIATSD